MKVVTKYHGKSKPSRKDAERLARQHLEAEGVKPTADKVAAYADEIVAGLKSSTKTKSPTKTKASTELEAAVERAERIARKSAIMPRGIGSIGARLIYEQRVAKVEKAKAKRSKREKAAKAAERDAYGRPATPKPEVERDGYGRAK